MENETVSIEEKTSRGIGRIIAIIAVVVAFVGLVLISNSQRQTSGDQLWNQEMSVGSLEARNFFIMYTDIMCPYCDVFSRATIEHWDEFTEYLASNDILFEIRLTDALYEGSDNKMSRDAAEAAYCAKRENKFWEFYHGAITALWQDYHSKGIGSSKTAAPITNMPDDYWLKIGHNDAGLGETFDNCVNNHETLEEVTTNTYRALQVSEGMPTFKFNKFTTSGFGENWGWEYVLRLLDAGLESK